MISQRESSGNLLNFSDLLNLFFFSFFFFNLYFFCFDSKSLLLLSLGGNKIRNIPESIGALTQLISLNLCDNNIEQIPSQIGRLHNIKSLSLHKNGIRTLPRELISLQNLTEVKFSAFPMRIFFALIKLLIEFFKAVAA